MNRELHRSAFREEELAHEDGFVMGVHAAIALLRAERYLDAAEVLERAKIVERRPGPPFSPEREVGK